MDRLRLDRSVSAVVILTAVLIATLVVAAEPASAGRRRCGGLRPTIVGSGMSERITGTPRRDVIVGGAGADIIRGRGGNDVICGGRDSDALLGGSGRDRLIGGSHRDTLSGRGGRDFMRGGKGADVIAPGRGRDVVNGGRGRDVVSYASSKRGVNVNLARRIGRGEGRDFLRRIEGAEGSLRDDRLAGTHRRNVLIGLSGKDRLFGRSGRDELSGGADGDLLHGGGGVDVVTHVFDRRGVYIRIGNPRPDRFRSIEIVEGSVFGDTIIGTRGADHIRGLADTDRLEGRAGDDLLDGGPNDDSLLGGAGDDQLNGGNGSDAIHYSSARGGVVIDFRTRRATGHGTDRFTDIQEARGSDFSDHVIGDDFSQTIETQGGDDVIDAAGGQDKIAGGDGADDIDAADGSDEIRGDGGNDTIVAGEGDDFVAAGAGSHWIDGGSGDDELGGGDLDDDIFGGIGSDIIHPRSGDDFADGGGDGDWIVYDSSGSAVRVDLSSNSATGDGNDVILGFQHIAGSEIDGDVLIGNDGPNIIHGEYGGSQTASDEMFGLGGNDSLVGRGGDELADGGSGADLCEATRFVDCELIEPDPPPLETTQADVPPPGSPPSFEPWSPSDDAGTAQSSSTSITYQVDFTHSGRIEGSSLTPPLNERWSRDFDGAVSYPVIADGRVFVTINRADDSSLLALDASSGATLWSRETVGSSVVSYADGRLYWVDDEGGLRALDPATGGAFWGQLLPFDLYTDSPPTVSGGVVYLEIGGGTGGLYAIDADTGRFLWGRDYVAGGPGAPAANEDGIFVGYAGPSILKYASDATLLWEFDGCCTGGRGAAVLHEGRVYAPGAGFVVDADSGEQVGHFFSFRPPAVIDDIGIFLLGRNLEAWDLYGGGLRWSIETGLYGSAPLIVGDHVYIVAGSGQVLAIDVQTGATTWAVDGVDPGLVTYSDMMPFTALGASHDLLVVPFARNLKAYS